MEEALRKLENDSYDLMVSETICLARPELKEMRFDELRFLVLFNVEAATNSKSYSSEEKESIIKGYMRAYNAVQERMIRIKQQERGLQYAKEHNCIAM